MGRALLPLLALASARAQLLHKDRATLESLARATEELEEPPPASAKSGAPAAGPRGICDGSVRQASGYVPVAEGTEYFFWLFEAASKPEQAPLAMWLSGGPGCSSQLALLKENGPCKVDEDGVRTRPNPYSWHNVANIMWVDQPAGVGFSTGRGTLSERGVAGNMYAFLQGFYGMFPEYRERPFFIFGESYAGHYIPAIAHRIWSGNREGAGLRVPLAGISIGNGLTNPGEQYKWYPEMGHFGGRRQGGHAPAGVVEAAAYEAQLVQLPHCERAIAACNRGLDPDPEVEVIRNQSACWEAYVVCQSMALPPFEVSGRNVYDMRIECAAGALCYNLSAVTAYLNSGEVQRTLGVRKPWREVNYGVTLPFMLSGDWMVNNQELLPDLLASGVQVLLYAGDVDYIVNWLGVKALALTLQWPHAAEFRAAGDKAWVMQGKEVAKIRSAQNLTFVQVYEAGHLVPMDQPAVSLEMVRSFLAGELKERPPLVITM